MPYINHLTVLGLIAYNLFLLLYKTGMILLSPWNPKAKAWLNGQKNILNDIKKAFDDRRPDGELIWMHCASLGEFEQGRPVLENIKTSHPDTCILITFFSPSGYQVRKDYKGADFIFYLPLDSPGHARRFLDISQPSLVLWVKYEYWYHYIAQIRKRKIPLLLVSGIFMKRQLFFKWYGHFYRKILECFTHIFVQDSQSKKILGSIGFSETVSISGDTRFDRVIDIAENFEPIPSIEKFCADHVVIVAGSTWQEDEEELDHFANTHPDIRFIIAPHEIDIEHLQQVKKLFLHSIFYSELQEQLANNSWQPSGKKNVLIIDNIGMLSRLYKYATISYIGGGFGSSGVHNILEAAVFGKPVVFGPVYDKFLEAEELVEAGGAFSIENALELEEVFRVLLKSAHEFKKASEASKNYVYEKRGAKDKITSYIMYQKLLSSPVDSPSGKTSFY